MRYIYTAITALLLGGMAAQAADYQPLVREGVRWHYNRVYGDQPMEEECVMFFEGDSIVNDVVYKKCIELQANGNRRVAALMREQDKIVYSIGGSTLAETREGVYDGEFVLYDFANPANMFPSYFLYYNELIQSSVDIDGMTCNCYSLGSYNKMIEGIGLDGSGTLTDHLFDIFTSIHYQYTGLSYVEQGGKIIYKGGTYEEPSTYQPLVREGVVWHYFYWNYDYEVTMYPYSTELNVQFKGDTTICGVQYKKCFLFDSPTLPDNALPVYYAREENGKVMFTQPRHQVVDTLHGAFMPEIPGEFFELNGETLVYDFSDMSSFAENIHAEIVSTSEVEVNGVPAKKYHLSLSDADELPVAYECDFVEGVGVDGINCGVLFRPFIVLSTGYYSRPCGFNKLTDLDGNVLYKGAQFDKYNSIDRVADDASAAADPRWYDLLGHPFDSRPTQPGVYIHQGKKVVVK